MLRWNQSLSSTNCALGRIVLFIWMAVAGKGREASFLQSWCNCTTSKSVLSWGSEDSPVLLFKDELVECVVGIIHKVLQQHWFTTGCSSQPRSGGTGSQVSPLWPGRPRLRRGLEGHHAWEVARCLDENLIRILSNAKGSKEKHMLTVEWSLKSKNRGCPGERYGDHHHFHHHHHHRPRHHRQKRRHGGIDVLVNNAGIAFKQAATFLFF